MPNDLTSPNPAQFNLASFADLLPDRDTIVGEDPGAFEGFRKGMMQSLLPFTPYECVVAENLISIEWELLQHRRMRDAGLRRRIHSMISSAVVSWEESLYDHKYKHAKAAHLASGGSQEDWTTKYDFDRHAALKKGEDLATLAISQKQTEQEQAYAEITALGLEPIQLMSEAYRAHDRAIILHDNKLPALERRRREVKNDFDRLQLTRPIEAEQTEA